MLAKREEEGEERLLVEECLKAQLDGIAARNLAKGREQGRRDLLRRMAERRFGAEAAQQLDLLLAATEDPERMSDIGIWIHACATVQELLERLRSAD